jgi:hypothetical protein
LASKDTLKVARLPIQVHIYQYQNHATTNHDGTEQRLIKTTTAMMEEEDSHIMD